MTGSMAIQTLICLQVVKRVQQLTGHRVRDPLISSASSMFDLWQALKTRPEPERLARANQLKKVNNLPNVTVHDGRRTPIHKHKEVGRWKVIEEELINRGLPVTGSRWQGAKTTSPVI
jgi:transposase InsO family protein